MIKANISTIKGTFVICKRVKKVPFYFRGDGYSKTSTTSRHAMRFTAKSVADEACKSLNDKRKGKGHKFRVENAEKHFVNSFSLQFNSYTHEVTIRNDLKSIQHVTNRGHTVKHSINADKIGIAASCALQIEKIKVAIKQEEEAAVRRVADFNTEITRLDCLIDYMNKTDLDKEFVEPNLTQTDRTVSVLYSSKQQPGLESQGSMTMLPLRK
jgi:hypothetical protein